MRRLGLLATALLAVPAAPAAAQWGEAPPVALGERASATCLRDAGGGRVAALAQPGGRYGAAFYRVAPDGLRADGEVLFGRMLSACPVVAAADDGAAVAAGVTRHGRWPGRTILRAAVRDPAGAFAAPAVLARVDTLDGEIVPAAAVGPGGAAAVAWRETRDATVDGNGRSVLRIVRRVPGGTFGPPQTLARFAGGWRDVAPALAIDAAGATTVAWARATGPDDAAIEVVTAAPGAAFGTPQRVAQGLDGVQHVALALAGGRALLAHDGDARVHVFERVPGAPGFAPAPGFPTEPGAERPALALAADGGAVVAWRIPPVTLLPPDANGPPVPAPPGADARAATQLDAGRLAAATRPSGADARAAVQLDASGVAAVTRPPGGAFGPAQRLEAVDREDADGAFSVAVYATDGAPIDLDGSLPRVAAGDGGQAAVAWLARARRLGDAVGARVAAGAAGGPLRTVALGSPVRDVDGVLPWLAGGPGAVWSDNRTRPMFDVFPAGLGRLHRSTAAAPAAAPPAPSVRLRARPQALYHNDPLFVDAVCSAACDLRATVGPRGQPHRDGTPRGLGFGTAGRASGGRVRLRIDPYYGHLAPRRGGRLRVRVRAAAPGGTALARAAIRVRVRRRTPPPFRRPLDVRARRAGDDVIVTWRTAAPARRMRFFAYGRRTRGRDVPFGERPVFAMRRGRGERRFRVRLGDARHVRWVVLHASAADPPARGARIVVPVR